MSAPLSNLQKREIAIAARRAYDARPDREEFELINSHLSRTACFEAWRHVENGKATGIQRSTAMTQDHYAAALAHFLKLAGDEPGAARVYERGQTNGKRVARWKLEEALRERGLQLGYAASICRAKYKRSLDDATEKQLWKLVFDVRSSKHKPLPKKPSENPF